MNEPGPATPFPSRDLIRLFRWAVGAQVGMARIIAAHPRTDVPEFAVSHDIERALDALNEWNWVDQGCDTGGRFGLLSQPLDDYGPLWMREPDWDRWE